MSSRNIFSQKHYVAIANLLGKAIAQEESLEQVINDFRSMFAKDYPPTGSIFHYQDLRFRSAIETAKNNELECKKERLIHVAILESDGVNTNE